MREKTVNISGKEVPLKMSAYTPILYTNLFHQNIFAEMQEIIEEASKKGTMPFEKIIVLYNLTYTMAKQADPSIPPFEEWLDQFDVYDIPSIAGDLIELWASDSHGQSTP